MGIILGIILGTVIIVGSFGLLIASLCLSAKKDDTALRQIVR